MNGPGHRALAAVCWIVAAPTVLATPTLTVLGLLPAIATSYGPASPDADNTPAAKRLDAALPDEMLGGSGPLQHRGLAHWIGWPVLGYGLVAPVPGWPGVLLMAAVVGWASHLLGDFFFGKAGYGTRAGVPILPWGWHVGLGLKVGTKTEAAVTMLLRLAAALMLLIALGWDESLTIWWEEFLQGLGGA